MGINTSNYCVIVWVVFATVSLCVCPQWKDSYTYTCMYTLTLHHKWEVHVYHVCLELAVDNYTCSLANQLTISYVHLKCSISFRFMLAFLLPAPTKFFPFYLYIIFPSSNKMHCVLLVFWPLYMFTSIIYV